MAIVSGYPIGCAPPGRDFDSDRRRYFRVGVNGSFAGPGPIPLILIPRAGVYNLCYWHIPGFTIPAKCVIINTAYMNAYNPIYGPGIFRIF